MTPTETEDAVVEALVDYHRRRAKGEPVDVFEYRDRLGESHADFLDVVETEAVLDSVLEPPPAEPLPRVFGAYTLLRELGRGAMGVVYEAVHRDLGRRVALKVLKTGFDTDQAARGRFRRETRACASVRHDHIVELYEAGEVEGRPFYAMALIEGRSLASLIKTREVPDARRLCAELAGVADALDHLHRAGIVHRDVKPSNIMVRPDGRMFLADFGHARAGDGLGLTMTGDVVGTPYYMSPEQLLGNRTAVDARTDVYALGATLYEAMSGTSVFTATELAMLAKMILSERPAPLRRVAPDTPAGVERIAMKALEKRPEDRYGSAAAMRDDLLAFAGSGQVRGRPVGVSVRAARFVRRRWLPIAAALLAALGGGYWWTHRPATVLLEGIPSDVTVSVGGEAKGRLPLELSLAPGTYELTFQSDRFADTVDSVTVAAGGHYGRRVLLLPRDPEDPIAKSRLASALGVTVARLEAPPGKTRSSIDGGPGVLFLWPRGDVRLADLETIGFEMGIPVEGTIEFRRGAEVLFLGAFEPKNLNEPTPFPDEARRKLKVGDVVTYSWKGDQRIPGIKDGDTRATFRVVGDTASSGLATLDAQLAGHPDLLREFRIQFLMGQGLASAALQEAKRWAHDRPTTLAAQALAYQAFKDLGLKQSRGAQVAAVAIHDAPAAQLKALFGAQGGTPVPAPATGAQPDK